MCKLVLYPVLCVLISFSELAAVAYIFMVECKFVVKFYLTSCQVLVFIFLFLTLRSPTKCYIIFYLLHEAE